MLALRIHERARMPAAVQERGARRSTRHLCEDLANAATDGPAAVGARDAARACLSR